MHDTTILDNACPAPVNDELADSYLVHAAVLEISGHPNATDDLLLSKLIRRRVSRLERVLSAHGGALIRQTPQGLLVSFDTAVGAVLVAAEMQRRCGVIPQIQGTRIGLKIGIHGATAGRDKEPGETAAWLGSLHDGDGIVVSGTVVDALPTILRQNTALLTGQPADIAAHLVVDWSAMPPPPAAAPASPVPPPIPPNTDKPRNIRLVLRQGDLNYSFSGEKPIITIGRDPTNDVVVKTQKVSRHHCRIIYRPDHLVLVDLSLNGTYVKSGSTPEEAIRKNMLTLAGSGRISFGHSCQVDTGQVFEYEIY